MLKLLLDFKDVVGANPGDCTFVEGFYGGSRAIVDPPPTDTDCDVVILVRNLGAFQDYLPYDWTTPEKAGKYLDESSTFITYRREEYNLMVFSDATEFGAVKAATAIAKHANIKDKAKRYRLFEIARSPWR
jgi:hypothetical protein